jgi:hypothetical protein
MEYYTRCRRSISRPGGTAGWLWNLRPGSRTLPYLNAGLPNHPVARAQADAHCGLRPRQRLSGSNLSDQARRPTHTTLDRLPDHAGLPVPHRSRAAGRVMNPRAGDHRTSLPGETPAVRSTHDRSRGEAQPPLPSKAA